MNRPSPMPALLRGQVETGVHSMECIRCSSNCIHSSDVAYTHVHNKKHIYIPMYAIIVYWHVCNTKMFIYNDIAS